MKILLLLKDQFPPFRVDVSVLIGREIPRLGHTVDALFQSIKPLKRSFQTEWGAGTAFIAASDPRSKIVSRIRKHSYDFLNDLKMFHLLRSARYDFVIVKDKFTAALLALAASHIFSVKFVYWLSYPFPEAWVQEGKQRIGWYPFLRLIRGFFCGFLLYKVILPLAEYVFVQSEQMKKDIAKEGIPEEKMTAVPMGISTRQISKFSEQTKLNTGNERIVLYLGKFFKVRKLEFLIRMFKRVLEDVPDAKFYFIGNGEDPSVDKMLKDEAKKLGIQERVVFTGYIPLNEALKYVIKATVCVSSYYPTFILNSTSPTKVIEYMAMGKAVVGNDHPEQKLLITKSGGGICVPYEESVFAKAVVKLLCNPEMALKMGQKGKTYVEKNRTYPVIAKNLESVLANIKKNKHDKVLMLVDLAISLKELWKNKL